MIVQFKFNQDDLKRFKLTPGKFYEVEESGHGGVAYYVPDDDGTTLLISRDRFYRIEEL